MVVCRRVSVATDITRTTVGAVMPFQSPTRRWAATAIRK